VKTHTRLSKADLTAVSSASPRGRNLPNFTETNLATLNKIISHYHQTFSRIPCFFLSLISSNTFNSGHRRDRHKPKNKYIDMETIMYNIRASLLSVYGLTDRSLLLLVLFLWISRLFGNRTARKLEWGVRGQLLVNKE
jgi:hypothetical protein